MTVAAVSGEIKAVDLVRDVNLKVNSPLTLSALTDDGEYELDAPIGSFDHGGLGGLADDDHVQYLLADGTRDVSGDMRWVSSAKILLDNSDQYLYATRATEVVLNAGTELHFGIGGTVIVFLSATQFKPVSTNIVDIGRPSARFKDAFFSGEIRGNVLRADEAVNPPLTITSTVKVTNLNVDRLDDMHVGTSGAAIGALNGNLTWSGTQLWEENGGFTLGKRFEFGGTESYVTSSAGNQLVVNGGAAIFLNIGTINKLLITSTILLAGARFQAPNFTSHIAIGTQPYACTSTTLNTNLNADLLDSKHASELNPTTTKGDLVGFSTVEARIPVGTDGQVLTADSGEALGVKWGTGLSTGTMIEDGVSDSEETFTSPADPVKALVLTTSAGIASVFYEAFGVLEGSTNSEDKWVVEVQDPANVTIKTITIKQDASGQGDHYHIPFYIKGRDLTPDTGAVGYHLKLTENLGVGTLKVLSARLVRVTS